MDISGLLEIGAKMIQQNDDPATSGLDIGGIAQALDTVLSGSGEETFDLASLVQKAMDGGLEEVVGTWIGQGENAPIEPERVGEIVDEKQIEIFAEKLGIGKESAQKALADALPVIVDKATPPEGGMLDDLLRQMGGLEGAMNLFGKMFR
jgi:uncharacterized protein YidB (DUF937 family)